MPSPRSTDIPGIELDGLERRYGERVALAGVSLTLPRGATLAVLGPNGAGKSTLLRVLATLLRPHAGTVRVLGEELPGGAWRVRGRIGYLGHEPLLYRDLSARENLTLHARLHGVGRGPRRRAARRGRPGPAGRRRRSTPTRAAWCSAASVARAVLHDPELVLLDEPRANLDPAAAAIVEPLLAGRTRVLTSHDPRDAESADAVLGLRDGRPHPARGPLRAVRRRPAVASARCCARSCALEWRTREAIPAMALFSVTTFVVFHFGLQRDTVDGALAAGVLWVTLLFAAMLGAGRLFVADSQDGALEGILLAPIDRTALLAAKAVAFAAFLAIVEVVAVPAFYLLLLGPGRRSAPILPLLAVLLLADVGIAVTGTLVAGLATQTRSRDLLVPLLGLPLLLPVIIAAARATAPLFAAGGAGALPAKWLAVLGLYDVIIGLIAFAVFDFLLED